MSQAGSYSTVAAGIDVTTLTGDAGGPISPTMAGNITLAGGNNITTTGAVNTITFDVTGTTQYAIQVGNATGSLDSLGLGTVNQVLTSGGAGTNPSWAASISMTWSIVGASATLVVNTGVICTTGAALSFALPAVSAVGDTCEVVLDGSTSWSITQAAGQSIRAGILASTVGAGGSVTSTLRGDAIKIVCEVANTTWIATSMVGNLNVV